MPTRGRLDRRRVSLLAAGHDSDSALGAIVGNVELAGHGVGVGYPITNLVAVTAELWCLNAVAPLRRQKCNAADRLGCHGNWGAYTSW
jgi:hypothetical protein